MKLSKNAIDHIQNLDLLKLLIKWCRENLEEEQELEIIIAFIADKFEFDIKDFSIIQLNKLTSEIRQKANRGKDKSINSELMYEPMLEFTKVGIVSLKKSFIRYYYEGTIYDTSPTYVLFVNGNEMTSRKMTDKQLEDFKDKLLILFDEEEIRNIEVIDKVESLYEIFKSPRMSNYIQGYNLMVETVMKLKEYQALSDDREEILNYRKKSFNKIIEMYLKYLWSNSNKDLKYVYSFESWIKKNKHMWGDGIKDSTEELNLFVAEHKEIVNIFKTLKEPDLIYYLCRKEERGNPCSAGSQEETTINGQDGI
tara:strand:- start:328 stop:1257 length:930 start_codon:yes stop_codon:yes gene_type:complete